MFSDTYINQTLSNNEEILLSVRPHWSNYVIPVTFLLLSFWLLTVSGTLGMILISASLYDILLILEKEVVITNQRVVCREGIFRINTEELKNTRIEAIDISRSFLDFIFGSGSIYFSGTGTSKVVFHNIDNPIKIKRQADEIISGTADIVSVQKKKKGHS